MSNIFVLFRYKDDGYIVTILCDRKKKTLLKFCDIEGKETGSIKCKKKWDDSLQFSPEITSATWVNRQKECSQLAQKERKCGRTANTKYCLLFSSIYFLDMFIFRLYICLCTFDFDLNSCRNIAPACSISLISGSFFLLRFIFFYFRNLL